MADRGTLKGIIRGYIPSTKKNIVEKQRKAAIEKGFQILQSWPSDVAIYKYGGHGSDVCQRGETLLKQKTPNNCLRVTISECGFDAYFAEETNDFFRSRKPSDIELARHPYIKKNLPALAKKLLYDEAIKPAKEKVTADVVEKIHIRYPGTEYVQAEFTPFQFHSMLPPLALQNTYSTHLLISHSGLLEKKRMEHTNIDVIQNMYLKDLQLNTKITQDISKDVFLQMLEDIGSHSPTHMDPLPTKVLQKYNKNAKEVLEILVEAFDIYFYSADEEFYKRVVTLLHDYKSAQALALSMFKTIPTLNGDFIQLFFNRYLFSFTRKQILDTYTASVFPTKEAVEQMMNNEYGAVEYFDEALCEDFLKMITRESGKLLSIQIRNNILKNLAEKRYIELEEAIYDTVKESLDAKLEKKEKIPIPSAFALKNAEAITKKMMSELNESIDEAVMKTSGEKVTVIMKATFKKVIEKAIQRGITAYIRSVSAKEHITKEMTEKVARDIADSITKTKSHPLWIELRKPIEEMLDQLVEKTFGNAVTSEKLMIQYPGIHYSTICRSLDTRDIVCAYRATRRRRASIVNETFRRKIQVQAEKQAIPHVQREAENDEEDKMNTQRLNKKQKEKEKADQESLKSYVQVKEQEKKEKIEKERRRMADAANLLGAGAGDARPMTPPIPEFLHLFNPVNAFRMFGPNHAEVLNSPRTPDYYEESPKTPPYYPEKKAGQGGGKTRKTKKKR